MTARRHSESASSSIADLEDTVRTIFLLSLICSLFLSSCAAVSPVVANPAELTVQLGALETIRGMQSVVRGDIGTMALLSADGDYVLLVWPRGVNYAMSVVATSGRQLASAYNGMKIPVIDLAEGINGLTAHGWKEIPTSTLPATLVSTIMSYSVHLIATGVQALPTILVIPMVAPFDPKPVEVQS